MHSVWSKTCIAASQTLLTIFHLISESSLQTYRSRLHSKTHCAVFDSKITHVGPDVPSGWDLTGCGCHSRFTKTSNEKLIWQAFKGKSFPQVNYFGREREREKKKINTAETLRHLWRVREPGLRWGSATTFFGWRTQTALCLWIIQIRTKTQRRCIQGDLIFLIILY